MPVVSLANAESQMKIKEITPKNTRINDTNNAPVFVFVFVLIQEAGLD